MPRSTIMGLVGALIIGLFVAPFVTIVQIPASVFAQTQTQQGDVSLNVIVTGSPPSIPAVITFPTNGIHVTTTPLVVSGTCQPNLEVRVYNNQALAGTSFCGADGTFIINIGLLVGRNELTVLNYDTLNRPGPASSTITVFVDEGESGGDSAIVGEGNAVSITNERSISKSLQQKPINPIFRLLGVQQSGGPVSAPQTIISLATIGALALYATDITLFGSAISTKISKYSVAVRNTLKRL